MAESSRLPPEITARRKTVSTHSQPLRTFDRTAVQHNRAIYANLPVLAREQLGVTGGDDLEVDVYTDRVVIRRADDG
jgi:hypothetical protein